MKFGQLIECNKRNIFRQKSFKSEAGRQVIDLTLYELKVSDFLVSIYTFFL